MARQDETIWADRYSRQTRFAPIGEAGQRKLAGSSVLIVGVGALGASLAQHMVRAGVGEVRLVDRDFVEPSNLQRQVLFDEADALAMLPKAVAAANKLRGINNEVMITAEVADVNAANVSKLAEGVQLVLDGTDNAATRLLLSAVCFRQRIPFIYGGAAGAEGMSAVLLPGHTACLRCLIGGQEAAGGGDTCDTLGVLSPIIELIASMQAVEAVKWLTGNASAIRRTWLSVSLWPFRMRESAIPSGQAGCVYCGDQQSGRGATREDGEIKPEAEELESSILCGRDTVQVTLGRPFELERLAEQLEQSDCAVTVNKYLVRAQLSSGESLVLFPDGRALVQGTADKDRAVQLCRFYLAGQSTGRPKSKIGALADG
ncbi:ThiF family adenylyltransferase [Paenibacillus harenae]|uniref:ThiF family adenylyltransferase n=1 Tax=Paenibacillus harenae TaxID=306543 RepID=UPI00042429BB|nr:ThiF family adenylyltransferase [Paenibacillus harenae]